MRLPPLASISALLLCACASTTTVAVDVHSDWVPTEEFDVVRVRVGDTERDYSVAGAESLVLAPLRSEALRVARGSVSIVVTLLRRARPIASRRATLRITETSIVPMWLLRSCASVRCPGSDPEATECDDGRCVRPDCTELACVGGCMADDDCPPPTATCAEASCVGGRCAMLPIAGACDASSYCSPESGCVLRGGADGGVRDAGLDAGLPDAGATDACVSAVTCNLVDDDCAGTCDPGCRTAILRAYRSASLAHLLTTDPGEPSARGFVTEGTTFWLYGSDLGGLVPLHRCYSPTAERFIYGNSTCEGWPDGMLEGVLGYMAPTPLCGGVPLYRLQQESRHLVTTSVSEVEALVGVGWVSHGVIGYVWAN